VKVISDVFEPGTNDCVFSAVLLFSPKYQPEAPPFAAESSIAGGA